MIHLHDHSFAPTKEYIGLVTWNITCGCNQLYVAVTNLVGGFRKLTIIINIEFNCIHYDKHVPIQLPKDKSSQYTWVN